MQRCITLLSLCLFGVDREFLHVIRIQIIVFHVIFFWVEVENKKEEENLKNKKRFLDLATKAKKKPFRHNNEVVEVVRIFPSKTTNQLMYSKFLKSASHK